MHCSMESNSNMRHLLRIRTILSLALVLCYCDVSSAEIRFNRDIRGLLADNCFACHGPDAAKRQGELRLDLRDQAIRRNDSGRASIVPGRPNESLLVERIEATDSSSIMPPPETHKRLTRAQIEIFKQWIADGAHYESHWSFTPLMIRSPPRVQRLEWVLNPIDHFVLSRLEQAGLSPSLPASKETLVRRVALDLTGLPPTIPEIESYLFDDSKYAYEKMVDHFLESPHYGERMAVDWLDAARFADTNGYQVDRDREVYAWREWVINTFNRNLSFDVFTIEQLAGDLLPNASIEQRVATGFHRNHMMNEEGGVLPEEFLAEYLADRVETTAAVWLGQTFSCARCHDHKYDPFTQHDFYGLKAFFNAVPEPGRGYYEKPIRESNPPFLSLPTPEQSRKKEALTADVEKRTRELELLPKVTDTMCSAWAGRLAAGEVEWQGATVNHLSTQSTASTLSLSPDQKKISITTDGGRQISLSLKIALARQPVTALRLGFLSTQTQNTLRLQSCTITTVGTRNTQEPSKVLLEPREVGHSLSLQELAKVLDEDQRSGTVLNLDQGIVKHAAFEIGNPALANSSSDLTINLQFNGVVAPFDLTVEFTTTATELLASKAIIELARQGFENLDKEKQATLREHVQSLSAEYRLASKQLKDAHEKLNELQLQIPTTLVMSEMEKPRSTYILMRGAYDKPAAEVTAQTPSVLPPMDSSLPRNRLGLARWLIDPQNPLTARVTVNRLWQSVFGTGLVRTSEDFGVQGEPPSHPELLDWLAIEFQQSGWNVKSLLKTILTSATYRQNSRATPELIAQDPENRLLARGPRFRLQAEFVRDQALAASGLLVRKLGGPSVKPYHPSGLYEQITAGNGTNVYVVGKGDELYRRSLYTYWKRSVPNPAMLIFDAPFRETCVLRRPRTNTPLQALNLLNDPTYIEAARCLAERMMREGGSDADSQIVFGFRLLLARRPQAEEFSIIRSSYVRARQDYANDTRAAKSLVEVGERPADSTIDVVSLAAMTTVALTLINLDETITKE